MASPLQHIPAWLKNKYLLSSVVFLTWILFFDDRDLISTVGRHRELKALEQSRDHYILENAATRKELEQIEHDPTIVEKLARENFRMKKDNEDLFIVPE